MAHRLSEKLNPASDDCLDFDWPTDADLVEVMRQHTEEGKALGDLQLIGVNNNKNLLKFNFVLGNGWRSSLQARVRMQETLIEPAGQVIKTIKVHYGEHNGLSCGLFGVTFLNKEGQKLLEAGDLEKATTVKEIVLEDDERVVGVKSRLNRGFPAFH